MRSNVYLDRILTICIMVLLGVILVLLSRIIIVPIPNIFSMILIILSVVFGVLFIFRKGIFERSEHAQKKWAKKLTPIIMSGGFLACCLIVLFSLPIALGTLFWGWSAVQAVLPSFIILAVSLVGFSSLEAPRLRTPVISVGLIRAKDRSYEGGLVTSVNLHAGKQNLLWVQITNLGINFYKDCTCWIILPQEFKIIDRPVFYEGIDFQKEFVIQKKNNCALFLPTKNYLCISPNNHLVLPLWIKTPKENKNYEVRIGLASETRWSEAEVKRVIKVV